MVNDADDVVSTPWQLAISRNLRHWQLTLVLIVSLNRWHAHARHVGELFFVFSYHTQWTQNVPPTS